MKRNFKKVISLFLLLAFLVPSVIRFEHQHDHHQSYKAENETHLHAFHEKCVVCNFEFSLFEAGSLIPELQNEHPSDKYTNTYISQYIFSLSRFSFSLRAPPSELV